ncbi:MAG: DUF2500 family protein [Kofleriaceae bacterium]
MATLRCDRCGATQTTDGAFCSYCGSRIIRPDQLKTALTTAADPARFDLVKASSAFELAMAHEARPPVAANIVAPIVMIGFVVVFVGVAASMFAGDSHTPPAFKFAFFAVPAVMAIVALVMIARGVKYAREPIQKEILVVVSEREEVSSGSENHSASTRYYATLQDRAGGRIEYETEGWLAGRIAATDIGVAFLKGMRLVEFLRIEPN